MELLEKVITCIEQADGKALATTIPGCLHVVPVSTVKVLDGKIILVNYFMGKTLENIQSNPEVSLAFWKGLEGYQVKGSVQYDTQGEIFDVIVQEVAQILPDRVVKGVLIITPEELYDVSAIIERPGSKIA